jgi:hypothetical protein
VRQGTAFTDPGFEMVDQVEIGLDRFAAVLFD